MSTPERRSATILVVDDEPANVILLQRILGRRPGWTVVGVTRSAEAVQRFTESRPDLVLLDLHMPAPDGFELLSELRGLLGPNDYLPVIVLTADPARESRERALELGASDFLTKPLDATEVVLRARNLLETRELHLRVAGENERLEAQVLQRTRELEHALEAARSANRAKDQFLANVSHELRTPLTAIRGAVGLLGGPLLNDAERARRLVDSAARNAGRLERLIQDVLLLQGVQSGSVEPEADPVDVRELVRSVVLAADAERADREVRLREVVPEPLRPLETDRGLLEQVLRRLVENAVRFTLQGEVVVEVESEAGTGRPLAIHVVDTGPGIDRERHEAIFHAFEQADNSDTRRHGGLGVGLTIARAICDVLGFVVTVRSAPGAGSCFSVQLAPTGLPQRAGADGYLLEGSDG